MNKHQIQIPDKVWEWAQKKYRCKNPATPLRDLLYDAMIKDLTGPKNLDSASEAFANAVVSDLDLKSRWRKLGLGDDPGDPGFMIAKSKFISVFDSEHDAVESVERRFANNYEPDGIVSNPHGFMVYLAKEVSR